MIGLLALAVALDDLTPAEEFTDTPEALLRWLRGDDVPAVPPAPDPHQVRAAAEFAEEVQRGELPSIRAIKKRMRMGQDKARQVRAYLGTLPVPVETTEVNL